jgi:hypothetical protein
MSYGTTDIMERKGIFYDFMETKNLSNSEKWDAVTLVDEIKQEYNSVSFAIVTDKINVYSNSENMELWFSFSLLKIKVYGKTLGNEDLLRIVEITKKLKDKIGLRFDVYSVVNDGYDSEIWILLYKNKENVI